MPANLRDMLLATHRPHLIDNAASLAREPKALHYGAPSPFDQRPYCLTRPKANGPLPVSEIVLKLCQMPVEMTAPLLRSDITDLTDEVLAAILKAMGAEHHSVVAQRTSLGRQVIKALINGQHSEALATLISRADVQLDDDDRETLFRLSLHDQPVREALLARGDTRSEMIRRKRAVAVSPAEDQTLNLRFLKAVRSGNYPRALSFAAPRLNLSIKTLQDGLKGPSPAPHVLVFRALGLDKAVYVHSLSQWLSLCGSDCTVAEARHPMVMALFDLSPQGAAAKLRALCGA